MRNGYSFDTLTSVYNQEIAEIGGEVIKILKMKKLMLCNYW